MNTLHAVPTSPATLEQLLADPYPHYRAMRELAPVVWVPAANRYFVTRYKDILQIERQPDVFSSQERDSMMNRAIGTTMLRLDGAPHSRIRTALEPGLRQGSISSKVAAQPSCSRISPLPVPRPVSGGSWD